MYVDGAEIGKLVCRDLGANPPVYQSATHLLGVNDNLQVGSYAHLGL
jgi:hypothetical protein